MPSYPKLLFSSALVLFLVVFVVNIGLSQQESPALYPPQQEQAGILDTLSGAIRSAINFVTRLFVGTQENPQLAGKEIDVSSFPWMNIGDVVIGDKRFTVMSKGPPREPFAVDAQGNFASLQSQSSAFPSMALVPAEGEPEFQGYIVEYVQSPVLAYRKDIEEKEIKKSPSRALNARQLQTIQAQVRTYKDQVAATQRTAEADLEARLFAGVPQTKGLDRRTKFERKVTGRAKNIFNGIGLDITDKEARNLSSSPFVKKIQKNFLAKTLLEQSVPLIGVDQVWQLDRDGNPCAQSGNPCLTGKGIKIAIIDTGVDYTHPDLGGCTTQQFIARQCAKVVGGYDFVNNDNDPMDDYGHGTHVAATAAGNGILKGVAPDALIYGLKVLDSRGSGTFIDIIEAIDWTTDPNRDGNFSDHLDVLNMSLGAWGDPDDPLSQAVDLAADAGVVSVVAAGNSGPQGRPNCVKPEDPTGSKYSICSPGTSRKAITVGATTKLDEVAGFSSRGPVLWNGQTLMKPDIAAPGVSICAARWDSWLSSFLCRDDKHIAINGTSMATPHVAGLAAILKQQHSGWTPDQIKETLKTTANDLSGVAPIAQGNGRMNALGAVLLASPPAVIELNPLPYAGLGVVPIAGRIVSGAIGLSALSYAPASLFASIPSLARKDSDEGWIPLPSSLPPAGGGAIGSLDTRIIADGSYVVRWKVRNADNIISVAYGFLEVDNLNLVYPLDSDIYRSGDVITPQVENQAALIGALAFSYGVGRNPAQWFDIGGGPWNTAGLSTGFYTLRAALLLNGATVAVDTVTLYLDSSLKSGWPVRVPSIGGYWGGYLVPTATDLDGDGQKEIVVVGSGSTLYAYRSDGSLFWKAHFGKLISGGNISVPLVGDVNGDGKKEIFIVVPNVTRQSFASSLYVFGFDGKPAAGISSPITLPGFYGAVASGLIADLDRDGTDEIVLVLFGNKVVVLNNNGRIVSQWDAPYVPWFYIPMPSPAVVNLDEDNDLEIIVAAPSKNSGFNFATQKWNFEGNIFAFNRDGSLVNGWPVVTDGIPFASPAVGDINGDGKPEIVVGLYGGSGGVFAFDAAGRVLTGWPQLLGEVILSSPSLGNMDEDNALEIGISVVESRPFPSTYLFKGNGGVVGGWPRNTLWADFFSPIMESFAGGPSIFTTAGGITRDSEVRGVYGWDSAGNPLPEFPKMTEADAQASAAIADLDKDGQAEVIASSDFDYDFKKYASKERGSLYVWETSMKLSGLTQWPMYHHDEQRTGFFNFSRLPTGSHDGAQGAVFWDQCTAFGWAMDPDDPSHPVNVGVTVDGGESKTTVSANKFRQDLQNAGACPGGNCAFSIDLRPYMQSGITAKVEVAAFDLQTGEKKTLSGFGAAQKLINDSLAVPNDPRSFNLPETFTLAAWVRYDGPVAS
ncbi:MAG: S8 family serine peptidase, partial [Candidatus Sungbacteria bacterium]|nr:S8 family serine peptidase [Candidatus Sungbacteria bacterium]